MQHRIARLHPFARVAMDLDDHAVQRRADLVAADVFLGGVDLGLGDRRLRGRRCAYSSFDFSMANLASVYFIS